MPKRKTVDKEYQDLMISLEDDNAIEETLYLMRSPKNYSRLLESVENVRGNRINKRNLIEE